MSLKRFGLALVVGLLLIALVAVPALAEEVGGSGTLHAEGSGSIYLRGGGQVWANGCPPIAGAGCTLAVRDLETPGNNPVVHISGYGWMTRAGDWYIYHGFEGSTLIAGTAIEVALQGHHVSLTASGSGIVRMIGRGTYRVNDGQIRLWPATVTFGQ